MIKTKKWMFANIQTHPSSSRSKLPSHGTTHHKRGVFDGPIPAEGKWNFCCSSQESADKQKHSQLQVLWEIWHHKLILRTSWRNIKNWAAFPEQHGCLHVCILSFICAALRITWSFRAFSINREEIGYATLSQSREKCGTKRFQSVLEAIGWIKFEKIPCI